MTTRNWSSLLTAAVHAGEPDPRPGGAVVLPIFQSATYLFEPGQDYHAIRYVRLNNSPNHLALHACLAELEQAEAAVVTSSGMAAISTALLGVLGRDDHLLAIDVPYGGTRNLITEDLPRWGITCTFIDGNDPETWRRVLRPGTRAIYVESITNPLMQVPDHEAVVEFAREHDLVSIIDNTFTSPVNFRPCTMGYDLALHSATKYLNGHSDLAAGVVIGRADLLERITHLLNHLGGTLDPHACFLLHRGIRTLTLRVRHQNDSALKIAQFLAAHPMIAHVNYPGLPNHRDHDRASRLFDGFGGMLSFEPEGGAEAAARIVQRVRLWLHAVSLGGVESLIVQPAVSAYAGVDPKTRATLGVTDSLIRLSIGIEDPDDLIADLDRALA